MVDIGCWTLAVVLYLLVPQLDTSDTADAAVRAPSAGDPAWAFGLLVLTGQIVALRWRSVRPRATLLAVAAAVPVAALVGTGDATGLTSLAVFVAVYTVVVALPLRSAWPSLAIAGTLVCVGHILNGLRLDDGAAASVGNALLQALGAIGLPLIGALVVRARRDVRTARQDRVHALAREREALLRAAVSHERMAMARELHDIAAHHLTGITVMTAAIGTQIDTDPAGAKEAVAQVRQSSRTLLRDLRSLVGLLREEPPLDQASGPAREQNLAGIAELVADAAGTSIEFTLLQMEENTSMGDGIGPLAHVAAYRIVGESLANAARHAPGARCRVTLDDRSADTVVITVENDPAGPSPHAEPGGGFGLVGMRERAELTGAELDYGPTPAGGWRVLLRLPRQLEPDAQVAP